MVWMLLSSVEEFVLVRAKRADRSARLEAKGKHQPDTRRPPRGSTAVTHKASALIAASVDFFFFFNLDFLRTVFGVKKFCTIGCFHVTGLFRRKLQMFLSAPIAGTEEKKCVVSSRGEKFKKSLRATL